MARAILLRAAALGLVAGLASGLLGVGGGIVLVPALAIWLRFEQHRAHATSLAAVIPIAIVGAATFGLDGETELSIAIALAIGSLLGVPVGAALMRRADSATLRIVFGAFMIVIGIVLALP